MHRVIKSFIVAITVLLVAAAAQAAPMYLSADETASVRVGYKVIEKDAPTNTLILRSKGRGRTLTRFTVPADQMANYAINSYVTVTMTLTRGDQMTSKNYMYSITAATIAAGLENQNQIMPNTQLDRRVSVDTSVESIEGMFTRFPFGGDSILQAKGNKPPMGITAGDAVRADLILRPYFTAADGEIIYGVVSFSRRAAAASSAW